MTQWWESLVQLRRSDAKKGSGVFISPTEILTAAHVVTRGSTPLPRAELVVDVRFHRALATVRTIAVPAAWAPGQIGTDIALVRVDTHPRLGLPVVFDHPVPSGTRMLEAVGFEAQADDLRTHDGNVACRVTSDDERLLFTDDFSPEAGMSGGPLVSGLANGVHVAGIITRSSVSGFIGLGLMSRVIDELRSALI